MTASLYSPWLNVTRVQCFDIVRRLHLEHQICHGDLEPRNVVRSKGGSVFIIDFTHADLSHDCTEEESCSELADLR